MTQESVTYLTSIGISVVLAAMLSHSWLSKGRKGPMGFWMTAVWMMVLTNCLFAARPYLPFSIGRVAPTVLVTVALGIILLGAQVTAGRKPALRALVAITLIHGIALVLFLWAEHLGYWRTAMNGAIWAGISIATFLAFRRAPAFFWNAVFSPANVIAVHAVFHVVRMISALVSGVFQSNLLSESIQVFGDLEAGVFIVAIYVSILVATMRQDDENLANARVEMATLSGLLPICAWCKKVRDDDGYWKQVEEYFSQRTHVDFTHSICTSCEAKLAEEAKQRRKGDLPPQGDSPAAGLN